MTISVSGQAVEALKTYPETVNLESTLLENIFHINLF
jgi:hypothetical protein